MPNFKIIILSQDKVTLVDEEDHDYLSQWKWCAVKNHGHFYAVRTDVEAIRKTVFMHRVIMNTPDDLVVDHIDGDGLNNQKHNLRNCSVSTNSLNNNSSGVSFFANRWYARITLSGKRVYLGRYKTREEAIRVCNVRKELRDAKR